VNQTEGPLLECRALAAGYGSLAVVRDLDLLVELGEVVALIGPNGAGKTTTLLTLAGELPAISGEVVFRGAVTKAPLFRRARQGMGFVTEERSVFKSLTAEEGGADDDATRNSGRDVLDGGAHNRGVVLAVHENESPQGLARPRERNGTRPL